MYIIIIGGGRLGYYLSKELINEGHEVLVIEKDPVKVEQIEEELGSICMQGDGCETSTLDEAGTERANLFIAVTDEDEDNLVACQLAKHRFNVPRIIARIGNPKNETLFRKLGIDVTVSATNLILEYIEEELPSHPVTHLFKLHDEELEIVEVKIPSTSTSIGKKISALSLPRESIISLLIRGKGVQIPTRETTLKVNDRVIVIVRHDLEEDLRSALVN